MNFILKILSILGFKSPRPFCDENTFYVWEPCTYSHAEVVPGFVKYLLDLGYNVSVLITPARYKEGLFEKFDNSDGRIHFNKLTQRQIKRFFYQNSWIWKKYCLGRNK